MSHSVKVSHDQVLLIIPILSLYCGEHILHMYCSYFLYKSCSCTVVDLLLRFSSYVLVTFFSKVCSHFLHLYCSHFLLHSFFTCSLYIFFICIHHISFTCIHVHIFFSLVLFTSCIVQVIFFTHIPHIFSHVL